MHVAARTLNLLVLLRRPNPSIQVNTEQLHAQTHHWSGNVLAQIECWIYHQRTTKNRSTSSRFARGSVARGLQAFWTPNAWRFALFVRGCISMATVVCAHGTATLTNRGPSELVEECIFYALQHGVYKKNDRLKNIFRCIWYKYKNNWIKLKNEEGIAGSKSAQIRDNRIYYTERALHPEASIPLRCRRRAERWEMHSQSYAV